jgi:hypothetical protein
MITIPEFVDIKKKIEWLIKNKSSLIDQKKSTVKHADAFAYYPSLVIGKDESESVVKAADSGSIIKDDATQIKARVIINTTKLFDSHGDVHLDQLWNKSLKEGEKYHVQEHAFNFQGVISDNVKAFTKQIAWHELGLNFEGKTQALIFDSVISKRDKWPMGTDMFDMYRTGKVKQHSVGMQYVKLDLAVNDERYEKEFAIWEKYFDEIANKDDVLTAGYFWAVSEAKFREGSAVLAGSNWATPTLSIQQTKDEPLKDTRKETEEPPKRTLKASELMSMYQPKNHI